MSELPGLRHRPLAEADVPAWWRLLDRAAGVDRPQVRDSEDWLLTCLRAEGFDPARHSIGGFDDGGELRAAAHVGLRLGDVVHLRLGLEGVVDPAWRGRGVGTALLDWGERTARARAATRRDELGAPVPAALQTWVEEHRDDLGQLLGRHGLGVLRWFRVMRLDLREGPPAPAAAPGGLRFVGLAEAAEVLGVAWADVDAAARAAHNETFADHWGSQPLTAADWTSFVTANDEFRRDWSVLALDGHGAVAGYALVYAHEADWPALGFEQAELGMLGVRRPFRRTGLARALLDAVAQRAHAAGMAALSLDVDTENPSGAVGLYERAGYVGVHRTSLWAKPL